MLHKDEVEALFEPRERQLPLPSSFAAMSRKKVAPIVEDDLEAQEQPDDDVGIPEKELHNTYDPIRAIEQIANDFAKLPHTADHSYFSLAFIFGAILFGSAFLNMWIFALPYHSVNDGLDANRSFFYGVLSYNEFIALIPWIETINYALPDAKIPAWSRMVAVVVGILSQKLLDAFIAEGWWNKEHETFFPIPFSTIVTEFLAVPVAIATLYVLNRHSFRGHYCKCCCVLTTYLFALFVAAIWAACFNRLSGNQWQKVWALTFGLLRFVVKLLFLAPTAIEINNKRWVILTLIIDLIFARIQVGTLPFIHDWLTMAALLAGSFGNLLWRYYSGFDRLQLLFGPLWSWVKGDGREVESLQESYGNSTIDIIVGVGMASLKVVHDTSARSIRTNSIVPNSLSRSSSMAALDTETPTGIRPASNVPEQSAVSVLANEAPPRCEPCCETSGRKSVAFGDAVRGSVRLPSIDEVHDSDAEFSEGNSPAVDELDEGVGESAEMFEDVDEIAYDVSVETVDDAIHKVFIDVDGDEVSGESVPVAFVDIPLDAERDKTMEHLSLQVDSGSVRNLTTNRRAMFANLKTALSSHKITHRELVLNATERLLAEEEEIWFQRQLYHIVDSVGSEILSLFVLMQHLGALWLGRNLSIQNHLNSTFDITTAQWIQTRRFGVAAVVGDFVVIASLTILFRRVKERKLTMSRVLSYIFRNNFWFIFLWVTATGAYSCATMINHFGADFTLNVMWRNCRTNGTMEWPGCV
jgi:hypothetical protein